MATGVNATQERMRAILIENTKKYMKGPWNISGSSNISYSKYWNWVFREFEKDFVKYYNADSHDFPESLFFRVTKAEAINSLTGKDVIYSTEKQLNDIVQIKGC